MSFSGNSRIQGNAGLGSAIAYYTSNGLVVSLPLTDSQEYDLIVDYDGVLAKVQVKTSSHIERSNYVVNLRVCGGNRSGTGKYKKFNNKLVDYVFILLEDGRMFNIPSSEILSTSSITMYAKYDRFQVSSFSG